MKQWLKQYKVMIALAFIAIGFSSCYVYGPRGYGYGYGHGHGPYYHHGYYHHYYHPY